MSDEVTNDPPVGLYFSVKIDGCELGSFSTCEGLSVEVQTEDREEGGENGFVHKLPVRMKYSNVKFTRPIGPDSKNIVDWFGHLAKGIKRTTATIVALTPDRQPLVTWNLAGVIPVKWQGPSFSAESPKVATETLEIAHHGFSTEGGSAWVSSKRPIS
jgi:phage tail-like protein